MKEFKKLHCLFFLLLNIYSVTSFATTNLTLEGPCTDGGNCTMRCVNSTGVVVNGLSFLYEGSVIVPCSNLVCFSVAPTVYNYALVDDGNAILEIVQYNNVSMSGIWSCKDGTATESSKVIRATDASEIPSGNLVITGSGDLPAKEVTCNIPQIGTARLVLTITTTSGTTVRANNSNAVSATVTEQGNVTCAVKWDEFPVYARTRFPSVTYNVTGSGCPCQCKCTVVKALVITLAILTAALLGWTLYLGFRPDGIWRGGERKKLEQWKMGITVFLIVATGSFIIAVGAYSLNCYRQCKDEGIKTNPGCFDAYCPEAYDASIALVVLGILVLIFAIVVLVLSCRPGGDSPSPPVESPSGPPGKDPRRFMLKIFIPVYFIKERETSFVRRDQLKLGIASSGLEMFWTSWPVKDPELSAEAGAIPLKGQKLCPVGIISSTDDLQHASQELKKYKEWNGPEPPETDIILKTKGEDLNNGFTLKDFVLVEFIMSKERHMHIVHRSSIELRKDDTGLESFTAALPPKDQETHAKKKTPPSDKWDRKPVMILGSADDFQSIEKALENFRKAQERNKRNGKPESQDERILSPGRKLPPLHREENTDTDQPPSEEKKKKKKIKKDQPESEERRPLPTPNQPPPETQRRPSTGAHVNMSASNNSPLPIMSTITPGHPASGQSGNALPPIGSSSFKKNQVGP